MHTPLHMQDPTGRFTGRADDYVRYRPNYPQAAIDRVLAGLGPPERLTVADVGAGTGISAHLLAHRACQVIAIEPNADMRDAAAPHPSIEWQDGCAESTGLGDDSIDVVVCAQAFHWFRADEALQEFCRILRARGRLALMWNVRDRSDSLTAGYSAAILEVAGDIAADEWGLEAETIAASGRFSPAERIDFENSQQLTREGLVGRATSASYIPRSGPIRDRLITQLEQLHARHADGDGVVSLRYITRVYLASKSK